MIILYNINLYHKSILLYILILPYCLNFLFTKNAPQSAKKTILAALFLTSVVTVNDLL